MTGAHDQSNFPRTQGGTSTGRSVPGSSLTARQEHSSPRADSRGVLSRDDQLEGDWFAAVCCWRFGRLAGALDHRVRFEINRPAPPPWPCHPVRRYGRTKTVVRLDRGAQHPVMGGPGPPRMPSKSVFHRRVEHSTSVNNNVTIPWGSGRSISGHPRRIPQRIRSNLVHRRTRPDHPCSHLVIAARRPLARSPARCGPR